MKISFLWVRYPAALLLISIMLFGCSGGNPSEPIVPRNQEGITLTLGILSPEPAQGVEVTIPVLVSDAENLYAFSFRVEFDPAGLKPVDVNWGDFKGETDATFNPLDRPGLLPLGYSRLDGRGFNGDGTVCTFKFTVLDPTRINIRIVDEPGYLVAYNPAHEILDLVVGGES